MAEMLGGKQNPFDRLEQENTDKLSKMAEMLGGKQNPLDRFKLHG